MRVFYQWPLTSFESTTTLWAMCEPCRLWIIALWPRRRVPRWRSGLWRHMSTTWSFDVDLEQLWPEPESVSVKLLGKLRDARETAAAGKRRFALKGRALPDDAAAAVDDAAEDAADAAEDAPPPGKPPRTSRFGLTRAGNDAANAPPSADEKAPPSASDAPRKGRFGFKSFEKAAPPPDASDDEVE
mmetsp:Transcript_18436/g.63463  ORF Transcript_18436/g.63463 Transcript_18436/m.63463 type:complete len:186 (-) Transcript_18436:57-614(-)